MNDPTAVTCLLAGGYVFGNIFYNLSERLAHLEPCRPHPSARCRPRHRLTAAGRRRFLAAAGAAATALGLGNLAGCRPVAAPLRIASNLWPGYQPLYLAHDLGWLDHDAVRLIELLSATDCMQALIAGTVEGAGLTLDEVLAGLHLPDVAENRQLLQPPTNTLFQTAQRLHDIMLANGLLPGPQPLEGLFDHRFQPDPGAA